MSHRLKGCVAIEVLVGPARESWAIQKALLTRHSLFFHRALLGVFREAYDKIVILPDDDPDAFGRFVPWLYTGSYTRSGAEPLLQCAKTWILGDKLGATAFKNLVIETLLDDPDYVTEPDDLRYVYAHTPAKSSLRQYLTDHVALQIMRIR